MKKVVITSKNPVKIKAVEKALEALFTGEKFEIISLALEKDGPEPMGKQELLQQINEALDAAREQVADADYVISIEGGMEDDGKDVFEIAHVGVCDSENRREYSGCATFKLPLTIAEEVRKGKPFGEAVDEFYKVKGTKQGGGFVKIVTDGFIDKENHCLQAVAIALGTLKNKEWY